MKDGDRAGFAAFNGHSGLLTISKKGDKQYLTMQTAVVNISEKDKKIESVDVSDKEQVSIPSTKIFLRIDADFRPGQDIATFYYSTDSKKWTKIGIDYKMKYDFTRLFMGTRYAIFNYATQKVGGYIDVDSFKIMHNAQCTMHN
jgi:beta-xylosidase